MSDGRAYPDLSFRSDVESYSWLVIPYSGRNGWVLARKTKSDFLATQESETGNNETRVGSL